MEGDACTTPANEPGLCEPVKRCTSLYKRAESAVGSKADRQYLRSSLCFKRKNIHYVCCPKDEVQTWLSEQEHLLPNRTICGQQITANILNGHESNIGEHSWAAQLWYSNGMLIARFDTAYDN